METGPSYLTGIYYLIGASLGREDGLLSPFFLTWNKMQFPALRLHLQLILELVTVLCVASTLSAIPDPRTKQWFALFSQHSVWSPRPHPPPLGLPCPSSCDLARLPGASLSSAAPKPVPAHSTSQSGPTPPRHKEPARPGQHHRTRSWWQSCCQIS